MKVQIENNLFLESDGMQFIIKEYTGKEDKQGNPTYKVHGYQSSITSALKGFLKMKIMQSTASNLLELQEDIKRIERFIDTKLSI